MTLAVLDTVDPGSSSGARSRATSSTWLDELAGDTAGPVLVFGHHHIWNLDADHRSDTYFGINPDDSEALAARRRPPREHRRLLRRAHAPQPGPPLRGGAQRAVRRGRVHEGLSRRVGRVPRVRRRLHAGRPARRPRRTRWRGPRRPAGCSPGSTATTPSASSTTAASPSASNPRCLCSSACSTATFCTNKWE